MKATRVGLVVFGLLLFGVGGFYLVTGVPAHQYVGILIWFAGALIVHDGILAPVVFGVSLVMRRAGKRMPFAVIAIVQGALVIAALFAAVVVPEILKKGIGTANPTLLPLDYGRNLAFFYGGLVVVTGAVIAGYLAITRRRGNKI